ncbi:TPA: MBL fold metallo-hydrolase, partial [Acinetobacter baumannii]|nr:MBL fold metallo-hydrolase [Acinetobacter baumannii]
MAFFYINEYTWFLLLRSVITSQEFVQKTKIMIHKIHHL